MKINAFISRLCVAILAFLGYSCNGLEMYGTPTGTWEIKGEVTEQETSEPAPATVKVTIPEVNSSQYSIIQTHTDENGEYVADNTGDTFASLKVVCIPDDPALEADSAVVNLNYTKYSGDKGWVIGTAEATANFRLKKKEQ